ncbi:MAG: hypothetical protein ACYS22_12415 [Planctomycetota bacterium]|jgi:hypothetical protein
MSETRGAWVAARLNELPHYVMFLYSQLVDARVDWHYKYPVFTALSYMFDDQAGLIPDDDPILRRIDDVCIAFRAFSDVLPVLPPAILAQTEESLFAAGINLRELYPQARQQFGAFYDAVAKLYPALLTRYSPYLGNAAATGELVRRLTTYVQTHTTEPIDSPRVAKIGAFLENFKG